MTTKFGKGIVYRKAQMCNKFHCPSLAVTMFSEDGEGRTQSSLVTESQKNPANFGEITVCNYPCYVRCPG